MKPVNVATDTFLWSDALDRAGNSLEGERSAGKTAARVCELTAAGGFARQMESSARAAHWDTWASLSNPELRRFILML